MKKIFVFGVLVLFVAIVFRPPEGVPSPLRMAMNVAGLIQGVHIRVAVQETSGKETEETTLSGETEESEETTLSGETSEDIQQSSSSE